VFSIFSVNAQSKTLTVQEYNWSNVITTNFTVPMVRFNFVDETDELKAKGNVTFFSSVGAGISYNWGSLYEFTDNNNLVNNHEFKNIIGIQAGFLFSADTGDTPTNVFALTFGINVLDFHIGYGYELGTITENQKRGFLSIAYSIPISKLTKGGLYIVNRGDEVENNNKSGFSF
jgi:hypothetical protein